MEARMNEMKLLHLYDFYFLEAMRAGISMAKSANASLEFKHSAVRLAYDVENAFEELSDTMAKRIRLYLFAAALGEARHAESPYYRKLWIEGLSGNSRTTVIKNSHKFALDETNTQILLDVFRQDGWGSSYGGKAWVRIVEAMSLYGKVANATFIDHAVDLEHNGGSIFSKDARGTTVNFDATYNIHPFLDLKFAENILTHKVAARVSGKVYRLLQRYSNIIEAVNMKCIENELEWLTPFDVESENRPLKLNKSGDDVESTELDERREDSYHCENCREKLDEDDIYSSPNGDVYCEECYDSKFSNCDECDKTFDRDEIVEVHTWKAQHNVCRECAGEMGAAKCNDCGDWHTEYDVTTDTSEVYCEYCAPNNCTYCELCSETHEDIKYHNEHEHADVYCKECEEIVRDLTEHVLENHYEPVELQEAEGFDNPLITIEPYKIIGTKTVKVGYNTQEWQAYYEAKGLKICKSNDDKFHIVPPLGMYFATKDTVYEAAKIFNAVKNLLDWTKITSIDEWKTVPEEKKSEIQKAIGG
jgi:hypothetical protein